LQSEPGPVQTSALTRTDFHNYLAGDILPSSDLLDRGGVQNVLNGQKRRLRNSGQLFASTWQELRRGEYGIS
jgi:hypothetical protein